MAVVRIERRLSQPRWLTFVVPLGSLVVAMGVMSIVLVATGHSPGATFHKIFDTAFASRSAINRMRPMPHNARNANLIRNQREQS